jgi:tetratricopeptide (TPR) repeat protein
LTIVREIGDSRSQGHTLGNLGIAYGQRGEFHRAISFFEQALLVQREIGDRLAESRDLWNMSLALDQLGQRAQAIQHAEQSLIIKEQIEDPFAPKVRATLAAWRESIQR